MSVDLDLLPEELETVRNEIKDRGRCPRCGHAFIFHHYMGGPDECQVEGCSCHN